MGALKILSFIYPHLFKFINENYLIIKEKSYIAEFKHSLAWSHETYLSLNISNIWVIIFGRHSLVKIGPARLLWHRIVPWKFQLLVIIFLVSDWLSPWSHDQIQSSDWSIQLVNPIIFVSSREQHPQYFWTKCTIIPASEYQIHHYFWDVTNFSCIPRNSWKLLLSSFAKTFINHSQE